MGCMACELVEHPERVPGGRVGSIGGWVVEHCVGSLGIGTMVVKPRRHVVHLSELNPNEVADLGPALSLVARAVGLAASESGEEPSQVYACLWSHADRRPGHIHFVVQPVGEALMRRFDAHGPELQLRMFTADAPMDPTSMIAAADRVRAHLSTSAAPDVSAGRTG